MASPALPVTLKSVQPYIKTAQEYEKRDPVLAYYCQMYAVQKGIKIDSKSNEAKTFLFSLMDQLEKKKKTMAHEEALTSEIVAQAHVEGKAIQLFVWADTEDRAARFNKNVVKSFYTAQVLFDVLSQFGEISEELEWKQKYAKWKAAYIHRCLKTGETPIPGPLGGEGEGAIGGVEAPGASPAESSASGSGTVPLYPPGNASTGMPEFSSEETLQPSFPQPSYQPQVPAKDVPAADSSPSSARSSTLSTKDFEQAQKLCRFAASALQYEDVPTAIDNLQKALALLQSK